MRKAKRFPGDIASSLVPRDITKFGRVGVILDVDAEAGRCTIRWYDKPAVQKDVIITQSSPGVISLPERGEVVLAIMDQYSRAFIVGYISLGHESKVKVLNTLPKFKAGERFFEAGGSYFYIRRNGNIVLSTITGGLVEFDNSSQTFKLEIVNWKLVTEAGSEVFGLIKRLVPNGDGTKSVQVIENSTGDLLTEYNLKLYETADGLAGINSSQEPLVEIILGTVVDENGQIINANGETELTNVKQIVAKLSFKSGVEILIDKEGKASIKGVRLNINNGSTEETDTTLGTNNPALGTEGQKVARVHDKTTVPLSPSYTDTKYKTLTEKAVLNQDTLTKLAAAFVSPAGPCVFVPSSLVGNVALEGEVTEGATNVYVGDE